METHWNIDDALTKHVYKSCTNERVTAFPMKGIGSFLIYGKGQELVASASAHSTDQKNLKYRSKNSIAAALSTSTVFICSIRIYYE